MMKKSCSWFCWLLLTLTCSVAQAQPEPDPDASKAFADVLNSYRQLDALRVQGTLNIQISSIDGTTTNTKKIIDLLYVKSGDGTIIFDSHYCYLNHGQMYVVHQDVDHSYYVEAFDDSPFWSLLIAFQDIPYPHLALFWGEEDPTDVWMQLMPQNPEIAPTQLTDIKIDGQPFQQITFEGPDGRLKLNIDPKTSYINSIEHVMTGGAFLTGGATCTTKYQYTCTTFEQPPATDEYTFTPGDRQRVANFASLKPPPSAPTTPAAQPESSLVGNTAPTFILATADGGAIDLADYRGQVVVLDFWSTWCMPCRHALPLLHQVAAWVEDKELPVRIFAVNVWEIRDAESNYPQSRLDAVNKFWKEQKFSIPVAMDYSDQTAADYGISGIPTTVIIRGDGTIHAVHVGAGDDYANMLRRDIREALDLIPQAEKSPDKDPQSDP